MIRGIQKLGAASMATVLTLGVMGVWPASADDSVIGQGGGSVILVLDGSGSMAESAGGGQNRMEAAQDGLRAVIDALPDDANVGLRVYGSTISDGPGSCEDSELLVPVDTVDKAKLKAGVDKLKPLGNTPIAHSLRKAFDDLPKEGPRSIVLVSDGEENCGGDPCRVARELKDKGAEFYVDVVGLQVDGKSRNQLTCIASAGGGTYYDVQDIGQLDATLKRASVRAARGYVESGLPVEGGTSAAEAEELTDGRWLDSIGDSGAEFYTVPDAGQGSLHVSVSTRTTSDRLTAIEELNIALANSAGQRCVSERAFVGGANNEKAPYAAYAVIGPEERATCGEGPYVLSVEPPEVDEVKPLEILVFSEPEVLNLDALPEPVGARDYSDETTAPAASGPATPVLGSVSFSGAPAVEPGLYSDSIIAGESLLYRVTGVGWGQQAVCDFTFGEVPGELGRYARAASASIYGPFRASLEEIGSSDNRTTYNGTEASVHVASPAVTFRNRDQTLGTVAGAAYAGDMYCALSLRSTRPEDDARFGEVPVTLSVAIVGDVAGEPEYASEPPETANDKAADDADGSGVWPWVAGAAAALLLAALLLWLVRRRRGRSSSQE